MLDAALGEGFLEFGDGAGEVGGGVFGSGEFAFAGEDKADGHFFDVVVELGDEVFWGGDTREGGFRGEESGVGIECADGERVGTRGDVDDGGADFDEPDIGGEGVAEFRRDGREGVIRFLLGGGGTGGKGKERHCNKTKVFCIHGMKHIMFGEGDAMCFFLDFHPCFVRRLRAFL